MTTNATGLVPLTTVAEAATALCVSQDKIRALIKAQKIGHVRIGGSLRIPLSEVERIATEGTS